MTITRRNALAQTGKALTAALVASVAAPGTAAALDHVAPHHEKVRRLARELAAELDGWMDGQFMAEIHPSKSRPDPVGFVELDKRDDRRWIVSPEMSAAIEAHRKAYAAWLAVLDLSDSAVLGREPTKTETRRYDRADIREEKTLFALCTLPARNAAEHHAKAKHLLTLDRKRHLAADHYTALLRSMMWAHRYRPHSV
jgi:hypothetical protein